MEEKKTAGKLFWLITAAALAALLLSEKLRASAGVIVVPFAAAYTAARLIRPAGAALSRLCRVNEKIGCLVWSVLVCFAAGYMLTLLSGSLWQQLCDMASLLPERAAAIAAEGEEIAGVLAGKLQRILPFGENGHAAENGGVHIGELALGAFRAAASEIGTAAAGVLGSAISGFPGGLVSVCIAVIAFIYLAADMDGAGKSVRNVLGCFAGEERVGVIVRTFAGFTDAVFLYLRAYLFLMAVTFLELSVGFTVIGAENPLALALIAAVIDALPFFGCGVVIVPWALWCLVEGNIRRGIALFVIEGVVYVVRQFLEPRVIGRMTGVHPFVALVVLYAGLKIGGVGGMILAPVTLMSVMRMRQE